MAAIPFMWPFPSWQFRANLFRVLWFVGRATSQQETAKQSLGWSLGLRRQIETGWSVRRCVSRGNHFAPLVHTHSFMHHEQRSSVADVTPVSRIRLTLRLLLLQLSGIAVCPMHTCGHEHMGQAFVIRVRWLCRQYVTTTPQESSL